MIKIAVPGHKDFTLEHLVLDFNGTLACDGRLIHGVKRGLHALADRLKVHVLTADIVCAGIVSALDLLANPKRIVATLRS